MATSEVPDHRRRGANGRAAIREDDASDSLERNAGSKPRNGTRSGSGRNPQKTGNRKGRKTSTRRRSSVNRTHNPRSNQQTSPSANRNIDVRRRKEKIRRRKRKHNRCAVLEQLIERLEAQAEVESRSIFGVTCRDVSYFVILFSVVLFFRSAISLYTTGVLPQLRQGYLFTTNHLDLIKGTEKIGFVVTVIFVALFGRRSHRPLLVASGVVILALGAIIWPVPFFMSSTQGKLNVSYGCNTSKISPPRSTLDVPANVYGQLCKRTRNTTSSFESCFSCPTNDGWMGRREEFLSIVCFAGFLMGFGTGLFLTSGTLYIEEANQKKHTPALQYGFLLFMSGLGEFLGSCFAWWFTSYPENLRASGQLAPWSVRAWWLGMVIFSVLLLSLSWTFAFFPRWIIEPSWSIERRSGQVRRLVKMLDAAKRDRQKRREQMKREKQRQKRGRQMASRVAGTGTQVELPNDADAAGTEAVNSSDSEADDGVMGEGDINPPPPPPPETEAKSSKGVTFGAVSDPDDLKLEVVTPAPSAQQGDRQGVANSVASSSSKTARGPRATQKQDKVSQILSECFSAIWSLVSNPKYLVFVLSVTLSAYLPAGYRTTIASFVRVQYRYDQLSAFFYADGLCYSLAEAIGSLVGGLIVWKLRLSLPRQLRLIISVLSINIVLFFLLFSVGCWKEQSLSADLTTPSAVSDWPSSDRCAEDCDCTGVQLEPVCSQGGARYLSPCEAGCTSLALRDSSLFYSSSVCSNRDSAGTGASSSTATEVSATFCATCSVFGAFWFLLFLAIVAHSIAFVSIVLFFLRVVGEERRQLSLSFAAWIVVLGAYVPGTAVFHGIESSSCRSWKVDCFVESVCWDHDVDKFRYVIHGANIAFQGVAIVGFLFILYLLEELNPCPKQAPYLDEFDLDEGHEHLRRGGKVSIVGVPSDAVLLGGGNEAESLDSREGVHRSRDGDQRVTYTRPVFETGELEIQTVPYNEPQILGEPVRLDYLEMTNNKGVGVLMQRLSDESDL